MCEPRFLDKLVGLEALGLRSQVAAFEQSRGGCCFP